MDNKKNSIIHLQTAKEIPQNFPEKVTINYDNETQFWKQEEVRNALGRPVTRIIFDRENNIILNVGDLITHHSIKEARQAGTLDILLASVYQNKSENSHA
ncbi:MAG: hypothetical protein QNJ47_12975 [Nostocaceae cyanobacterium]|nr:hypothetical protein [Nostocaceae cyanobacterium]